MSASASWKPIWVEYSLEHPWLGSERFFLFCNFNLQSTFLLFFLLTFHLSASQEVISTTFTSRFYDFPPRRSVQQKSQSLEVKVAVITSAHTVSEEGISFVYTACILMLCHWPCVGTLMSRPHFQFSMALFISIAFHPKVALLNKNLMYRCIFFFFQQQGHLSIMIKKMRVRSRHYVIEMFSA